MMSAFSLCPAIRVHRLRELLMKDRLVMCFLVGVVTFGEEIQRKFVEIDFDLFGLGLTQAIMGVGGAWQGAGEVTQFGELLTLLGKSERRVHYYFIIIGPNRSRYVVMDGQW